MAAHLENAGSEHRKVLMYRQGRTWQDWASDMEERLSALERYHARRTKIHSSKFWSRAWAVFGHYLAAMLLIYMILALIALIAVIVGLALGADFFGR
jgi:Flp pilus assembly protein TadB